MAGKLHKDYDKYISGGGIELIPGRRQRAYAEGFVGGRGGMLQTANPHPAWQNTDQNSAWWAWDQGWRDWNTNKPSTHVGGPAKP